MQRSFTPATQRSTTARMLNPKKFPNRPLVNTFTTFNRRDFFMNAIAHPDTTRLRDTSLPESMREIIGVLGYDASLRLVKHYGGVTQSGKVTAQHSKHNSPHPLNNALSFEEITRLTEWTRGTLLYIPLCDAAIRAARRDSFTDDYHRLLGEGCSGRMAMAMLCPRYGFSDRTGWKILRRWRESGGQNV